MEVHFINYSYYPSSSFFPFSKYSPFFFPLSLALLILLFSFLSLYSVKISCASKEHWRCRYKPNVVGREKMGLGEHQGKILFSAQSFESWMLFLGTALWEAVIVNKTFLLMKYTFHRDIAFCRAVFCKSKGKKKLSSSIHSLLETAKCWWRQHLENLSGCVAKKDYNKLVPQINCLHFVFPNTLDSYLTTLELKYKQTHVNTCKYMYTHTHTVCIYSNCKFCLLATSEFITCTDAAGSPLPWIFALAETWEMIIYYKIPSTQPIPFPSSRPFYAGERAKHLCSCGAQRPCECLPSFTAARRPRSISRGISAARAFISSIC